MFNCLILQISMDEINQSYDVTRHPKVLGGHWTEEQCRHEFLNHWDMNGDGVVTVDEFLDYYSWISTSITKDDFFEQVVINGWPSMLRH